MCGRYTLTVPAEVVAELFALDEVPELAPRYNIAPTQEAPVIRLDPRPDPPRRRLHLLRWGLVPYWADDPSIGNRMINCRVETAAEKPAYREVFRRHRCLVVADGFYEWKKDPGGKQPFWAHRPDGRPFAFAGLWSRWRHGGGRLDTYTILTTEPSPHLAPLHDRMPAILDPADWSAWLDPEVSDPVELRAMIARADGRDLALRPVGRQVNTASYDEPDCVEPLTAPAD
ncbi:MAG TPA: SOS response-associated peptidase [Thermoanaerobaculia bacterium]|nr:SOS response-associated peptidase [Thermoanaerobaculia bacterium]